MRRTTTTAKEDIKEHEEKDVEAAGGS